VGTVPHCAWPDSVENPGNHANHVTTGHTARPHAAGLDRSFKVVVGDVRTSIGTFTRIVCGIDGRPFPGRIVVAADGPGHPEDAVRAAVAIAQRPASDVILVQVASERRATRPEVAAVLAELADATDRRPIELAVGGRPHRALAEYAMRECALGGLVSVVARARSRGFAKPNDVHRAIRGPAGAGSSRSR
jgi:universal stress protein family protein